VYTVTSTADNIARDGAVTLREAITAINTHQQSGDAPAGTSGVNTIRFDLPGSGVHVLRLNSALPAITGEVVIDGTTQPGSQPGRPLVEIDGSWAGSYANGLVLAGGYSSVRGLVIDHFGGNGIVLSSNHNTVTGDFVGIDPLGYFAAGSGSDGILVTGIGNTIGGTAAADRVVISGNKGAGIDLDGTSATWNVIQGCYIGTDGTGFASVANGTGILVRAGASQNIIGGTTRAARNVVTGNRLNEIELTGTLTANNRIQGDYIGVDATGLNAALSGGDGILLDSGTNNNTIGGATSGAGNLIGGAGHIGSTWPSVGAGVHIIGATTRSNVVQGNWIGINAAGLAALGNLGGGIVISNATGNTIGGWTELAHNLVADASNSSGLSSTNQLLPAYWYINSIQYLNHPSLLTGSFVPVRA
jgi:hypothetical protein